MTLPDRGSLADHREVLRELWECHRSGNLASGDLAVRVLHLLESLGPEPTGHARITRVVIGGAP